MENARKNQSSSIDIREVSLEECLRIIVEQESVIQLQSEQNQRLSEQNQLQCEQIRILSDKVLQLEDQIKKLTKQNERPKISPSTLETPARGKGKGSKGGKRPGSAKKKKAVKIDRTEIIKAENVPPGSRQKGYQDFLVQDITIETNNTLYRLERWQGPDGKMYVGQLPSQLKGQHFGPKLRQYIIHQYHGQMATEPALLDQLRQLGFDISSGQLHALLTEGQETFHKEKESRLQAGLSSSAGYPSGRHGSSPCG